MKTEREQREWEALAGVLAPRLLEALRRHTGVPGLEYAVPPAPLSGGHWASLHTFRLAQAPQALSGELVLRVMPASDEEARREAAVQTAVRAAGFPAPEVRFSAGRGGGLGFPFLIMSRVPGGTFKAGLTLPEKAAAAARLPVMLAETLAELHGLDEKPVLAALAAAGWDRESVGLDAAFAGLAERAAPLELEGFAAGVAWLKARRPSSGRAVVCHGDFHPLNLMVEGGEVSSLLDWSHALLAEPEYDAAYAAQLLAFWPLRVPLLPRGLLRELAGRPAAWQFTRAYRQLRPLDPDRLAWCEALHAFQLLVRVARARAGITVPPLARTHPWELVARDAARAFQRRTEIGVVLPGRRDPG